MPKPDSGIPRWETKAVVEVRIGIEGQVWLWHQGRTWPCVETLQVQAQAKPMAKKQRNLRPHADPASNHPWRAPFSRKQLQQLQPSTASG